MSDLVNEFTITLDQLDDFEFRVRLDKPQHADLAMDEPPPLGKDAAPNAGRMLAAAIGNCLSASFLFSARKSGVKLGKIHAEVKVQIVRNEKRRLRVGKIVVLLDPAIDPADHEKAVASLSQFEEFCTITQSVRQGIPVEVHVRGLHPE